MWQDILNRLKRGITYRTAAFRRTALRGIGAAVDALQDWMHTLKRYGCQAIARLWSALSRHTRFPKVESVVNGLRDFIRQRRGTYVLFMLTCVALAFCVTSIQHSLTIDEPVTQIALTPSDGLTIAGVYVEILYRRDGPSRLNLIVSFPGTTDNRGKELQLFTSPNLQRRPLKLGGQVRAHEDQQYFYVLREMDRFILRDAFEGNLFGRHAQELNLTLEMFLGSDARGINQIWRRVVIRDLADVTFSTIDPEPQERSPTVIAFEFDATPEVTGPPGSHIHLSGMDRKLASRSQFRLFAIGAMTGVLASIVASIVVEAVKHLDERSIR